jgi:hypothetical protein
VGASHQSGCTGLVASLIQEQGERRQQPELKPLEVSHQ